MAIYRHPPQPQQRPPHVGWKSPATLSPATIAGSRAVLTPAISSTVTLSPATIPQHRAVYTPKVAGPINPGTIAGSRQVFAPTIKLQQKLLPATIPGTRQVFSPVLAFSKTLSPGTVAGSRQVFAPIVRGGHQYLSVLTAAGGRRVLTPTVTGGQQGTFLFLSGVDRSDYLNYGDAAPRLHVESQTMGRWSCRFSLYVQGGAFSPVLGQTCIVMDFGDRLFAGCLTEVVVERIAGTGGQNASTTVPAHTRFHCAATDKSGICDHRVVSGKQYLIADWSDYSAVIKDIAANFLNGEGVTTGGVPATLGALVADLKFNFPSVTNAFDQIARDSGTVWWVDVDGTLNFSPLANFPAAPFSLTETSRNWRNLSVKTTTTGLLNKLYAISNLNIQPNAVGGPQNGYTETFTLTAGQPGVTLAFANGVLFLAQLQLSAAVGSIISMTVNGHAQTVYDFITTGYNGQTSSGANDDVWFFGKGETIVQWAGPSGPTPPLGATIVINYLPDSATNTSIAQYGTAINPLNPMSQPLGTCGSGVYEGVVQVDNTTSQIDLNAIALADLNRIGGVPTFCDFETDDPGLRPGQLLTINLPLSGIPTRQLLITQMGGDHFPPTLGRGGSFRWKVQACSSLDLGNWVKWQERLIARTAHPLPVLQYETATFVLSPGGSISAAVNATNPYPVQRTGLAVECQWSWSQPPVDEDVVVTITRNNANIVSTRLSQNVGANLNTLIPIPSADHLYIFRGDILNINVSYAVTGHNPTPAASLTFIVRWSI